VISDFRFGIWDLGFWNYLLLVADRQTELTFNLFNQSKKQKIQNISLTFIFLLLSFIFYLLHE